MRRAPTRAYAFRAARDLATEALAREAERNWLRGETVSIKVAVDPEPQDDPVGAESALAAIARAANPTLPL
jgi:hypothetical protein